MKTRYLTLFLTATGAVFAVGGCSGSSTLDPNVDARLRNDLPGVCTAAQIQACPAVEVTHCPNGQEPVIDYSSDCCAHFTCQPICQVANRSCLMTPAPVCPAGTKLWIGTAVEDCCPAYRCEPDGTTCDPTRHAAAACTLALPYCGPNLEPVVVGQTSDCCPIYQCPCVTTPIATTDPTTGAPLPPTMDVRYCGCTTPSCKAGEEVVCEGKDACMGPCSCQPARGICTNDANCAADERCDVSSCRLPPVPADMNAATCDPAKCGPQLGIATVMCSDGSIGGSTGRCLLNANGSCGWEIRSCPADCYGICVPNIQSGCRASTDCPTGQTCEVSCAGWGCATGGMTTTGTTMDPSTGTSVPPGSTCTCPASDPSCVCDANGNCKGQQCVGRCVPEQPKCDPNKPVACPTFAPVCPNGVMPVPNGVDPMTCCQTYTCPVCDPRAATSTGASSVCPAIKCACAKVVGTDPTTCCPRYECGGVDASGACI
jgi:hypothetical protein